MLDHMRRSVLVGVDHTPKSQLALHWAVEEAGHRHLPLRVVHVREWPPYVPPGGVDAAVPLPEESGSDVLDRAVAFARERLGSGGVSAALLHGRATPVLLDEAARARLVVVGSRGRTPAAAAMLGSVGAALASHAHCPVVVVRAPESTPVPDGGVVVGVDGSEQSERAVAFAFEEAAARGLPLFAYHCWQRDAHTTQPPRWDGLGAGTGEEHDGPERWLSEALAGFGEKYPDVDVTARVVEGHTASVLAVRSAGAHLLVVGSRGRGGFAGLLLGSVSQSLLHHAHCPVAVVRDEHRAVALASPLAPPERVSGRGSG